VECNPRFAAHLRRLLDQAGHIDGRVHATTIEDHEPEHRYDGIVSALPLTNFTPEAVDLIIGRYSAMLGAEGWLTYFAYLGTYPLRRLVANSAEAERHRAVQVLLQDFQVQHRVRQRRVWANLPPAVVTELCMTPAPLNAVSGSSPLPGSAAGPVR
jgi:phospholipid N-methyltransferase